MRLLLWNVKRGPGERRLAWLADQAWDVAIILEVTGSGWRRLTTDGRWTTSGTYPDHSGSHRYATAILARGDAQLSGEIDPPRFEALGGRYQERVHAASLQSDGHDWTIVAAHMPNSVVRRGPRDHGPKDACYQSLADWLSERPDTDRVVLGIDANRGDWPKSTSEVSGNGPIAQQFLRGQHHGLRDVCLDDPQVAKRPETYWTRRGGSYRGHYYDRILVSPSVGVVAPPIFHTSVGRPPGALSDHAAVSVTLR